MKAKATNARRRRQGRRSGEGARQEILAAAVEFLWEYSLRDLTIPKLMDRTSRGRSTFYDYFRDRYQLIEILLEIVKNAMTQAIYPWLKGGNEPLKEVRESLRAVIDVYVIHGPVIRAVSEAAPLDPKLDILWNGFLKTFDKAIESAIVRDQRAGLIAPINVAETAYAINRMNIGYLNGRFGRVPQADPETVLNCIFGYMSRTLFIKAEYPPDTGPEGKKRHLGEAAN